MPSRLENADADNIPTLDGDEIRIKNTFIQNITELVTKEIGNNVQTVSPHHPSSSTPHQHHFLLQNMLTLYLFNSLPSTWAPAPTRPTPSTT